MGRRIGSDGSVTLTALEHPLSDINVLYKTFDELIPIVQDRYLKGYQLRKGPKVVLWLDSDSDIAWGKAVDGVRMRITQGKFTIAPGEKPDLHIDIHSGGKNRR